jgi:stage V sporulation protein R
MASVLQVVRNTSLFFQPQIRTKILNEGWASYWHELLFLDDDRIKGNEVGFARVNAKVTALPRVGLNPYALGMRLFAWVKEQADRGAYTVAFDRLRDARERQRYDSKAGGGSDLIFSVREHFSDFMFINSFVNQGFVNRHRLFVSERRLNQERMVWEYTVKSRRAEDYRGMLLDALYHPPRVVVDKERSTDGFLYLNHLFEGKPLVREYIPNTLMGIEFLWGGPVKLETSEVAERPAEPGREEQPARLEFRRVVYTMKERRLKKEAV